MRPLASLLLALPLLSALLAVPSATVAVQNPAPEAQPQRPVLLPDPSTSILLEPEENGALDSALRQLCAASGVSLFIGEDAKARLAQGAESLDAAIEIPADQAWSFVGTLLMENELAMILRRDTEPRLLSIQSLRGGSPRTNLKQGALFVDREGLAGLAKHPALLVTTTVEMPHLDVRNVVNSLRGLMTDNATQGMLPVGDSNSIVLTGFGAYILSLVEMLEDIDRKAGERTAQRLAEGGPAVEQGGDDRGYGDE